MSDPAVAALLEQVKPLINRRVGPYIGWNPVTRTQIWQWCMAMGDQNPLYLNDEYRSTNTGFTGAVAPPTMMQMWTMRAVNGEHGPGSTLQNPYAILHIMEQHGFAGVMAVSYDQTFHRYLEEGDHVTSYSTIVNISDLKTTALGKGFFVTEKAEFEDQHQEVFAEALITYFQYQAPAKHPGTKKSSAPGKINRVHPVENQDNAHYWQGLRDGKLLIQRCTSCNTLRHPPQPMCERCQSLQWDSIEASGKGTVYSYTTMYYPEIPPFDYPNTIVLVDLAEGVRLVSQLLNCKPEDVKIGMKVEMKIAEVQDGMSLPQFYPVAGARP